VARRIRERAATGRALLLPALVKKHYRTRNDLRADGFDYIESFLQSTPTRSTIGSICPVQFENLNAPNGSVRDAG
jgi:hypothetical protein